jgi:GTP-binding protein Era
VVVTRFTEEKEGEEGKFRHVKASVVVERASQKPIVIGKGGEKIKEVGIASRAELERAFGVKKIMLELSVKVDQNWRRDKAKLVKYGYADE